MVRSQGDLLFGFLPAWGVFYQPVAFVIFMMIKAINSAKRKEEAAPAARLRRVARPAGSSDRGAATFRDCG